MQNSKEVELWKITGGSEKKIARNTLLCIVRMYKKKIIINERMKSMYLRLTEKNKKINYENNTYISI